jgi:hypothetical protein
MARGESSGWKKLGDRNPKAGNAATVSSSLFFAKGVSGRFETKMKA